MFGRFVVLGTLALAHIVASRTHVDAATAFRVHQGLLGWDAGWYESIAAHGYGGAGHLSLRFWPLLPLAGRALAVVPGVSAGAGVVVVANVTSLFGIALVARLAAAETGDMALARRAAWLMAVAPPAFVYVMGYAEGLLLLLTTATFLALRQRHWWWAAAAGTLAGLARPLGVVLMAPALVECARSWWEPRWQGYRLAHGRRRGGIPVALTMSGEAGGTSDNPAAADGAPAASIASPGAGTGERKGGGGAGARSGGMLGRVAAVLGPAFGLGIFLGWVQWRYHNGLAPIEIQQRGDLHGHLADPIQTMAHDVAVLLHGHHLDQGLHVPWVVLVVALTVVVFWRLPASYGFFTLGILAVALSGPNLDSFERYALSAFPVVIAGGALTASPRVERVVMAASVAGLVAYGLMAFLNILVP